MLISCLRSFEFSYCDTRKTTYEFRKAYKTTNGLQQLTQGSSQISNYVKYAPHEYNAHQATASHISRRGKISSGEADRKNPEKSRTKLIMATLYKACKFRFPICSSARVVV